MALHIMSWEPTDSDFGTQFTLWDRAGRPATWSTGMNDELESCAYYLLGIPTNEGDAGLRSFLKAMEASPSR